MADDKPSFWQHPIDYIEAEAKIVQEMFQRQWNSGPKEPNSLAECPGEPMGAAGLAFFPASEFANEASRIQGFSKFLFDQVDSGKTGKVSLEDVLKFERNNPQLDEHGKAALHAVARLFHDPAIKIDTLNKKELADAVNRNMMTSVASTIGQNMGGPGGFR